ncbi:MAG: hypothetical protein U9Q29_04275 [Campylobacterota bacterium]|nr:hypothetical protein [Campylobacterota bacterium]
MKIAVECKSPLLQKSLELFLSPFLTSLKQCDIVVRDEKCLNDVKCFYISNDKRADLIKPFSKSQLILALENRYKSMVSDDLISKDEVQPIEEDPLDFDILEKRIDFLTREYKENILKAVRAFYEK